MNIVLLSGGSGKRLWPLSNDSRSKQFLKLLKNEEGQYESMVQRVYGQIRKAGIDAHIVVATGASQVDSIRSQLGKNVDVVVEPERRDTFPAIALASVYLALEKGMDENEVVLVLPVDPYADIEYFHAMIEMEKAVQAGIADMVLMGIRPTYPSEKYGYIVPESQPVEAEGVTAWPVKRFQEKPSYEKAKMLLEDGALWNGGVFAFKLGYLLETVRKYQSFGEKGKNSFEEFRSHYGCLKKISFDYEVVEKTESIAMIPYEGKWKDLGTWNTLAEEIAEPAMGHVLLGEGTKDTTVINETSLPVIGLGLNNLIVAASPDGILISDKGASSYLKPYAEKVSERPMYEELIWGDYRVTDYVQYADKSCSLTKHTFIQKGRYIGYQCHKKRDEIWTIVDGDGEVIIDGHSRNVRRGDVVYLTAGQKHALRALSDVHLIEVQIGRELEENDIEEFTWTW
ncbi:sugar phosphate nucleotidyltransferase [Lacrimispora sp. 210928-DFI.3.58]|uniref:sugar phosphate nucleotidyltransferase n=1 Tax=Lacrimispora sp. 210928-DFI.3.58 TaxID=2883214 RepID=UPI0015B6D9B3|nr:sugar phosphate nucleotidyltransferase [Lacrimispora sp. 210928-DFI.3.58]MCB7319573.1 cupin domain-containing protein [Lacrimispora sp. 210928-DFI.3.58]